MDLYSDPAVPQKLKDYIAKSSRPKKSPLKPLDPESWKLMHGKARWDSMVALRGPDFNLSDNLKFFTTSVIRYRMSEVERVGGMVNRICPFVVLPADFGKDAFSKTKGFDYQHFLDHVKTAANWLSIPIVVVKGSTFTEMISCGGVDAGIYALLKSKELPDELVSVLASRGYQLEGGG